MSDIGKMSWTVEVNKDKAIAGLKQVQQEAQTTDSKMSSSGGKINKDFVGKVGQGLTSVGKTMTAVGAGIVTSIGGIVMAGANWSAEVAGQQFLYNNLDKSIQKSIDANAKNAKQIGLTSQQYKNSATSISTYYKNMGLTAEETANLSGETMNLVADLGAVVDMPFDEAMSRFKSGLMGNYEALDAFGVNLSANTLQNSEYVKSLGKSWNQLSDNEKMMAAYNEIMRQAAPMQGLAAQEAGEFGMQMKLLWQSVKETVGEIGSKLLPVLEPLVKKFLEATENVAKWVSENPKLTQTILAIVGGLGVLLAIAGPIIMVIGMAAMAMAGFSMASLPVIGIVAGIALAITALIAIGIALAANWDTIKAKCSEVWNNIKEVISQVWEAVKSKTTEVWNSIKDWCSQTWDGIKQAISNTWNTIKQVTSTVWDAIKGVVTAIWNVIKGLVTTYFNAYKTVITTVWNAVKSVTSAVWNTIKGVVSGIWNGIKSLASSVFNAIKSVISSVWNAVSSVTSSVWNAIKGIITSVTSGIKSTITSVFNGIKSTITSVMNTIKSTISNAWNTIKGIFSTVLKPNIKMPKISISGGFSLNPPSVPKFGITWHYKGAIFKKPTVLGNIGVGDANNGIGNQPEAILPLDHIQGYFDNSAKKFFKDANQGENVTYQVEFNFSDIKIQNESDMNKLAEIMDKKLQSIANRKTRRGGFSYAK